MNEKKASKNKITIPHLLLACRHVQEMLDAGITYNFAIRTLEHWADWYSNHYKSTRGKFQVYSVRNIDLWSKAALRDKKKHPKKRPLEYLRVEHGTPRRAFAGMVLKLFKSKRLNENSVNRLADRYWQLAVITLEEDRRLNKMARSKAYPSPAKRWAAAGIMF